jgi:ceramide glucosyltransferase
MSTPVAPVFAEAVRLIGLGLAAGYLLTLALLHVLARRYFGRPDRPEAAIAAHPAVSLICSLRGEDPGALDNFRSFFRQDYLGAFEIIFSVESPSDPAVALARAAMAEFPERESRMIVGVPGLGRSVGKHKNMISGYRASRRPIIIFSDQDVRLPPSFVTCAVRAASSPGVGLTFPAPLYVGAENAPAAFYKLAYNPISLLFLGAMAESGHLKTVIGSILVFRRDVFENIRGEDLLEANNIGDDMVLPREVRRAGYRIHLMKETVRIHLPRQTWRGLWRQYQRWFIIVRHYYPVRTILAMTAVFPFLWSLGSAAAALLTGGGPALGLGLAAAALAAEGATMTAIEIHWIQERKWGAFLRIVPVFEPLFLLIFLSSLFFRKIRWRGESWRITHFPLAPKEGP